MAVHEVFWKEAKESDNKKKGESRPKAVLQAPIRLQHEDAILLNNAKALIDEHPAETKSVIEEGRSLLNVKQDHIKIADKYGWENLLRYLRKETVDGDERRVA